MYHPYTVEETGNAFEMESASIFLLTQTEENRGGSTQKNLTTLLDFCEGGSRRVK